MSNKIRFSLILLLLSANLGLAEVTEKNSLTEDVKSSFPKDKYHPAKAAFSKSYKTAVSYQDPDWNALGLSMRATYVKSVLEEIIALKGYTYIEVNSLLCIINKESEYLPNRRTTSSRSTASGLGQVTNTTIAGLLKQKWFSPINSSFSKKLSSDSYRQKTADSIVEQLNLIVSTIHLKRVESRSKDMTTLIKRYRGADKNTNARYAQKIESCRSCIATNGITNKCLNKVK